MFFTYSSLTARFGCGQESPSLDGGWGLFSKPCRVLILSTGKRCSVRTRGGWWPLVLKSTLYTSIRHSTSRHPAVSHVRTTPEQLSVCHSWHSHVCQPVRHFPASPRRKSRHAAPSVRHLKHCQAFCFTTDRSQIFAYTNSPQISMLMESISNSLSFCVITVLSTGFNSLKKTKSGFWV